MAFEADREPRVGEMFGRYRLDEKLGAGGVGEVWRATDTSLDRVVAIKMLLPRFRDDAESAARFHREAKLAAGLRHAHIVRVHFFGETEKRLYIDMELIEGDSLAAALGETGPWNPARVLEVLEPVARALDYAHNVGDDPDRRGLVHRDVKPANVLLEERRGQPEHVYLVDFGIARAVAPGQSITGAGAIVGTPAYMAPELWGEGRPDHRVDVYALTAMLFEMLTGRLPYPRSSIESFIAAHVGEAVPAVSAVRPGLPRGLDDVIARGLAKKPGERYATAGELVRSAAAAVAAAGRETVEIPPDRGRRTLVAGPDVAETSAGPSGVEADRVLPDVAVPDVAVPDVAVPDVAGPDVAEPDATVVLPPPDRPDRDGSEPGHPDDHEGSSGTGRGSWFSSRAHFAGLAATALLIPIALFDLVPLGWALLLPFVLLYALGAVLALVVAPHR